MKEKPIRTVALNTNPVKDAGLATFRLVGAYLLERGFSVRVPLEYAEENAAFEGCGEPDALYRGADCAVLLGGDGTILRAARYTVPAGCPMLGINLGRLGFMTELEPEEYRTLDRLSSGDYEIEKRMTLAVSVAENGRRVSACEAALNDAVISCGAGRRLLDLSLACGDREVSLYRCDGLILSTPTGSTAYAMSAGGPVLDPLLRCLSVVPICPVSPAATPLVFAGDAVMTVKNRCEREESVLLTVDGRISVPVPRGASVECRVSPYTAKMIKLKDNRFFSVLKRKIN
ncbi:MAG: NAD(+)/NADH kinase [Clostridia bacterium]|nr:NAD(+)/NADH kinase [Clostridia bacterium]